MQDVGGQMMEEKYSVGEYPKEYCDQKRREVRTFVIFIGGFVLFSVIVACIISVIFAVRGNRDYVVRMQQYCVEYSDQYDYWDVCTIEYPQIEGAGLDADVKNKLNDLMYDTAMEKANYWHFEPNAEVRRLQEEEYEIFSNDVTCKVHHHSQYLLSFSFEEIYAPASPVYYVNFTKRALNVDLATGEQYELADIIRIDEDFVKFWVRKVNEEYGDIYPEEQKTYDALLAWFLGEDAEWEESYAVVPYFYMAEDKYFVIGLSVDDKYLSAQPPQKNYADMLCEVEELEAFKRKSDFWEKYHKAQTSGRIEECDDKHENLWLGDSASTWLFWDERGDWLAP